MSLDKISEWIFDGKWSGIMSKIRFVTLHPAGVNVDLTKDEGQIPYTLCTEHGVEASIVACHIDTETANMDCVKGLKVKHFPFILSNALTGAIYILINAKKIDWLNIYFAGRQAYCWTRLYKLLNPRGHVYLKLDMDFRSSTLYDENTVEREVFRKNTEVVDIVSVESTAIRERIAKYSEKDILLISNGISRLDFSPQINGMRDNMFLTVGRLGTKQKATEILLQAFAKSADRHNWKLKLIGRIEEGFVEYIKEFYNKYPELKERVIFAGEIKERKTLYSEYCHAKVFVLPSRWESFGISCGEALSCGCRLIITNTIPPAREMTNSGKFGSIIDAENIDVLAEELVKASKRTYSKEDINELVEYANEQFSWSSICERLYHEMERIDEEKL